MFKKVLIYILIFISILILFIQIDNKTVKYHKSVGDYEQLIEFRDCAFYMDSVLGDICREKEIDRAKKLVTTRYSSTILTFNQYIPIKYKNLVPFLYSIIMIFIIILKCKFCRKNELK